MLGEPRISIRAAPRSDPDGRHNCVSRSTRSGQELIFSAPSTPGPLYPTESSLASMRQPSGFDDATLGHLV